MPIRLVVDLRSRHGVDSKTNLLARLAVTKFPLAVGGMLLEGQYIGQVRVPVAFHQRLHFFFFGSAFVLVSNSGARNRAVFRQSKHWWPTGWPGFLRATSRSSGVHSSAWSCSPATSGV